jgi:hypothetical protein
VVVEAAADADHDADPTLAKGLGFLNELRGRVRDRK